MNEPRQIRSSDDAGTLRPDNSAVVAALLAEDGLDPIYAVRRATGLSRLASLPPVIAAELSGDESIRVLCRDGAHYLVTPWNAYRETSSGRTIRLTSRTYVTRSPHVRHDLDTAEAVEAAASC